MPGTGRQDIARSCGSPKGFPRPSQERRRRSCRSVVARSTGRGPRSLKHWFPFFKFCSMIPNRLLRTSLTTIVVEHSQSYAVISKVGCRSLLTLLSARRCKAMLSIAIFNIILLPRPFFRTISFILSDILATASA
jgi:hypothetical protein